MRSGSSGQEASKIVLWGRRCRVGSKHILRVDEQPYSHSCMVLLKPLQHLMLLCRQDFSMQHGDKDIYVFTFIAVSELTILVSSRQELIW